MLGIAMDVFLGLVLLLFPVQGVSQYDDQTTTMGLCTCPDGWVPWGLDCYLNRCNTGEPGEDFASAEQICVSKGGHLASIRSRSENIVVHHLFDQNVCRRQCWIGLHGLASNDLKWCDGNAITINKLPSGQPCGPPAGNAKEHCVVINELGIWETAPHCSLKLGFICKTERKC